MYAPEVVLIPRGSYERITNWDSSWGTIDYQYDEVEGVVVVTGSSKADVTRIGTDTLAWADEHYLKVRPVRAAGLWYRADPDCLDANRYMRAKSLTMGIGGLEHYVGSSWRIPDPNARSLVLTWALVDGTPEFAAWWVFDDVAMPADLEVVTDRSDWSFLAPQWPVDALADTHVMVIGCGSIGGSIAVGLASASIPKLTLVDPDRLLERNVVRHELSRRHLGRHKVTALAGELRVRHRDLEVIPLVLNAVSGADRVRPLLRDISLVVCATDGVESRRVVNHLARRAGVSAIFACVLEDGAFGEVVRVDLGSGCLWCLRRSLIENGSMDPEPGIDLGYGTGTSHRPMTAVPTDLRLVADLGTKAAIATLLRRKGYADQVLAGEHAVLGLRPLPNRPAPFDIDKCGDIKWGPVVASYPDCVTCSPP